MTSDYTDDEVLSGIDPQSTAKVDRADSRSPAGAQSPATDSRGVWVLHIPHPTMPGRRTVFEAALVLLLLLSLVGRGTPWTHWPTPFPPGPAPVAGPLEAKLVHDLERDGFATAKLKADATLAPALKALDCQWEWVDAAGPEAASLLKGNPTPVVAIVAKGKTDPISVTKAPQTGAEVVAIVKALRGKKD